MPSLESCSIVRMTAIAYRKGMPCYPAVVGMLVGQYERRIPELLVCRG